MKGLPGTPFVIVAKSLVVCMGACLVACRSARPVPGYVESLSTLEREYKQFYEMPLVNSDILEGFQQAAAKAKQGDYREAVGLLKPISRQAALPAVYNNLGTLYAQMKDVPAALNAFRMALARDPDYQAARANLERLKKSGPPSQDALMEAEPNNDNRAANELPLGIPMRAEITAEIGDVDCYRIVAPRLPRDILEIEIANRSATLIPRLDLYDENGLPLDWGAPAGEPPGKPGVSMKLRISPQPNQVLYLDISGALSTSGFYTLTVRALKAFDRYEPNDNIFAAREIHPGQTIEANIMDSGDTDYFSFTAPRTGTVSIDIHNQSAELIPALTTFQPDKSNSGFGLDVKTPGGSLHHTMEVQAGQMYFLQVWSRGKTAGAYLLTLN